MQVSLTSDELRPATLGEARAEARRIYREIAANNSHPAALANPQSQSAALMQARREVERYWAEPAAIAVIRRPRQACGGSADRADTAPHVPHRGLPAADQTAPIVTGPGKPGILSFSA